MVGLVPLQEEKEIPKIPLSVMQVPRKGPVRTQPGRGLSPEPGHAGTPISDF